MNRQHFCAEESFSNGKSSNKKSQKLNLKNERRFYRNLLIEINFLKVRKEKECRGNGQTRTYKKKCSGNCN